MHHAIFLEDVVKVYPISDGKDLVVLNNVDLKIRQGEFVSVVGPTGCGKSTLLRMVLGWEQPTSGTFLINGEPPTGPSRDRGIVFQKYGLFPQLTVMQNIAFGLDLEAHTVTERLLGRFLTGYRRRMNRFRKEAREYLDRIGLHPDDGDKFPHQLSGGMRQRVAIAQSLIMQPDILLMDEPFGALDHSTREEMQLFLLERWEDTGKTILFVTHELEEAIFLGTRVIVLSQYWSGGEGQQGATIVLDKVTPGGHPKPTSVKDSREFLDLKEQILGIREWEDDGTATRQFVHDLIAEELLKGRLLQSSQTSSAETPATTLHGPQGFTETRM